MSNAPLMPMATAVWLVENTSLTFKQIAIFCNLHEVEVQGIADGEVAKGIKGYNPIISGQLSREEIELSSKDENRPLKIKDSDIQISNDDKKIKKYIPLSKRQDKPDSALWLVRYHNILKDSQIAKLVGITKNSVTSIRNKSYWNYNNLNPKDPVALNLFTQKDLLEAIEKAERRIKREKKEKEKTTKIKVKLMNKINRHRNLKVITNPLLEVVIKIEVKDNNVEQALRVLKRKLQRDGFFKIIKLKNTYENHLRKKKRILQENIKRVKSLISLKIEYKIPRGGAVW